MLKYPASWPSTSEVSRSGTHPARSRYPRNRKGGDGWILLAAAYRRYLEVQLVRSGGSYNPESRSTFFCGRRGGSPITCQINRANGSGPIFGDKVVSRLLLSQLVLHLIHELAFNPRSGSMRRRAIETGRFGHAEVAVLQSTFLVGRARTLAPYRPPPRRFAAMRSAVPYGKQSRCARSPRGGQVAAWADFEQCSSVNGAVPRRPQDCGTVR